MAKRYYSDAVLMYGDSELVRIYKERLEQTEAKLSELTSGAKPSKSVLDSQIAETDKDIAICEFDEKEQKKTARRLGKIMVGLTVLTISYVAAILVFASPWLLPSALVFAWGYYVATDDWLDAHSCINKHARRSIELWAKRTQLVQGLVDA
jgi:hypothetical protein